MKKIKTFDFNDLQLEIEIKDLSFVIEAQKVLGKPHRTSFYQLIWLTSGQMTFIIDFKPTTIHKNEMLLITCGQVCQFDITSKYKGYAILFTPSFLSESELDTNFIYTSEIFNPINLNKSFNLPHQVLQSLITLLKNEINLPPDQHQHKIARSYMRAILLQMERHYIQPINNTFNPKVREFINAVEKNYKNNRQTSFYAKLLNVREKALNSKLDSVLGKSAKEYIDSRIILEAKRYLSYSNLSVKEIGFNLGFDEPTNFNKYFRKHTNTTPLKFREQHSK